MVMRDYKSLLELKPDILDYWSDKNNCNPSNVKLSSFSHTYFWLVCPLCGKEYQKTYNSIVTKSYYCKECSAKVCSIKERSLRYKYPDIADMFDNSGMNKLTSDKVYSRSDEKYYFKCEKCENIFLQSCNKIVELREKGSSACGVCSGNVVKVGINDVKAKNKLAYKYWDFEKNLKSPEEVHYRSHSEYWFKCDKGHSFQSSLERIALREEKGLNEICPICMGTKVVEGINDCKTLNPFATELWDYSKNAKKPEEVYYKSENKYWFKCPKGHEFQRDVVGMLLSYERSKGSDRVKCGCPLCSKSKLEIGKNDCKTLNPYAFKYWDYEKNKDRPENVYYKSHKKYWFKCGKGHSFKRSAYAMYRSYLVDKNGGKSYNGCIICSERKLPEKCQEGINDIGTLYPELLKRWDYELNDQNKKYISDFIKGLGLNVIEEYTLPNGKSVDIYIPDKKIAFDYNGLYWHSEHKGRDKWYHLNKINYCKKIGFRLYYIWEDDYTKNKERVLNWVKEKLGKSNDKKVNARECEVGYVSRKEAENFLNTYHIQEYSTMSTSIGLYSEGTLVAVLSYSVDTTDRNIINIKRYCTSCNVRGGFSKLLKKLEDYCTKAGYKGIITFSDNSISDGDLYKKTGFKVIKEVEPTYSYLVKGSREHKFNYRKKRFKEDNSLVYKEGLSEKELADLNKLYRIYDSGKLKWYKGV